jgi:hypothetical protein
MFSNKSRYANLDTAVLTLPGREPVIYVRRRMIPQFTGTVVAEYVVHEGDRLDRITAHYLADPELFWRVCDANDALKPEDLLVTGQRLKIPLAGGG